MRRTRPSRRVGRLALLPVGLAAVSVLSFAAVAPAAAVGEDEMIVYRPGERVPDSDLVDLGAPADLGGTVLEGNPRISARIDYANGNLLAGVFQATRGKVRIHFPFSEHATILDGEVELTDQWGNNAVLRPGDSYFITQGSIILWDVRPQAVQKTFFNRTEAADSPAPMVVYKQRQEIEQSELVDLGPPEGLGGTVLSGDPHISAEVDYQAGPATAGVFQATRGDVQVHFPFTEPATVIEGSVSLTDSTGRTERLEPGDTYLIKQGRSILWQVAKSRVQKSFFNVV